MKNPLKHIITLVAALITVVTAANAQQTFTGDTIYNPDIIYSPLPKVYEIAGIRVEGVKQTDDYIIIANSGLSIGERVELPGAILTAATKRLWRQGLYSSVKISAEKIYDNKVWLVITLKQQPRMSEMRFEGAKNSEKKDIQERLSMVPGQQITPNIISRATQKIKDYYPFGISL